MTRTEILREFSKFAFSFPAGNRYELILEHYYERLNRGEPYESALLLEQMENTIKRENAYWG